MQIRVIRGAGDKQGSDITDPLITDNAVGVARGTKEINESVSKKIVDANCPLSDHTYTGTFCQVSTSRERYRGKVTFFSQTIDIDTKSNRYYPATAIRIERVKK